jgi:hypothetical protein
VTQAFELGDQPAGVGLVVAAGQPLLLHLRVPQFVVTGFWRAFRRLSRMPKRGQLDDHSRRRERERRQRRDAERSSSQAAQTDSANAPETWRRRATAATCGWCGGSVTPGRRGPIPKWCSASCRHRAWEQRRAAASGRSAVEVVERHVPVRVAVQPRRKEWPRLLEELARQIDDGRIYDRDLLDLSEELDTVLQSFRRRPFVRSGAMDEQRRASPRRRSIV